MFKAKQFKSKRDLKSLSISSPLHTHTLSFSTFSTESKLSGGSTHSMSSLSSNHKSSVSSKSSTYSTTSTDSDSGIVLMVKYNFKGENKQELSAKTNDFVKFLHRPGNGWLYVKSLETGEKGLIPASYVNIIVNDLINPITIEWLKDTVPSGVDSNTTNPRNSEDLFEFERLTFPQEIVVSKVLKYNDRIWYRIDIICNNGDSIYISKFYQDFYNLHISLTQLNHSLPKLPSLIKISDKTLDYQYDEIISRCNELGEYFDQLLKNPKYKKSQELYDWIMESNKVTNPENKSDKFINDELFINSEILYDLVDINKGETNGTHRIQQASQNNSHTPNHITKPTTKPSTSLQSINSLIEGYTQREPAEYPTNNETASIQSNPLTPRSLELENHQRILLTPFTPNDNKVFLDESVKVKVHLKNQENDTVVFKVKHSQLQSLTILKNMILHKVYKDDELINHYKLRITRSDKDITDEELMQYIQSNTKVSLDIIPIRANIPQR